MSDSTESRAFKIVVFAASAFTFGFAVANVVYFSKIRNGETISKTAATSMLVLNVIILIISFIILIWILYKIVFSQEYRSTVTTNVKTYLQEPSHGFVQQYPVTTGQVVYQTQPTVYNPNLIVSPQNIVYG